MHAAHTATHTHTHTQLKLMGEEKRHLQEQNSRLQQEVGSCNLEILDLNDKLERARKKQSERRRQSLDKFHASKYAVCAG